MAALIIEYLPYGALCSVVFAIIKKISGSIYNRKQLPKYYGGQPPKKDPKDKDEADKPD